MMPNLYGMNNFQNNLQNYQSPYSSYPQINNSYMPQQTQQNQSLIRVNGENGAKAYQMGPNSVVPLFDANDDIMYIKMTDGAGFGSYRKFRFKEIFDIPEQSQPQTEYVSREEFNQFKQEMINNGKQFIQQSDETSKQSNNSSNTASKTNGKHTTNEYV